MTWVDLPAEGFAGPVPDAPSLLGFSVAESELWSELWRKPQAAMWSKLGLQLEVAAYVRAFLESVQADASAGLKTVVLRMADGIGLSLSGMHQLRWRIKSDELGERRSAVGRTDARSRLAVLSQPEPDDLDRVLAEFE